MPESDDDNLDLSSSPQAVDSLNKAFYGRFPYPWPPATFPLIADADLERVMFNQSIGGWRRDVVARNASIWVAGCGTNQAIYTALKFPGATIVASDISTGSLEVSKRTAASLGLSNIDFRQESLNQVSYKDQFDYVICTGVIHHNAEPASPLKRISEALRADGVLELMVYNRFHRFLMTGVQKAVRIFSRAAGREADFDAEFKIAKAIINTGPMPPIIKQHYGNAADATFADAWLQPVERSYTVESMNELAAGCGLRLLLPCLNLHDYSNSLFSWDVSFDDQAMQKQYDDLNDVDRWYVSNLLLGGRSPMLWFYVCKEDSAHYPPNLEREICDQFLDIYFERVNTTMRNYVKGGGGAYQLNPADLPYPSIAENPLVRRIVEISHPSRTMGETLASLGVSPGNRKLINEIRVQTTTPLCPYLKAVG